MRQDEGRGKQPRKVQSNFTEEAQEVMEGVFHRVTNRHQGEILKTSIEPGRKITLEIDVKELNHQRVLDAIDLLVGAGIVVTADVGKSETRRSSAQHRAMQLYWRQLAAAMNELNLDMRVVLKPDVQIPWSRDSVEEWIWKPIQKVHTGKKSSRDLSTKEVGEIYDIVNRHLSETRGVHVRFPSREG